MFYCQWWPRARGLRGLVPVVLVALTGVLWLRLPFATAQQAAITPTTISTVAGGGFGANAPARQAPMELPTALVFDPSGRGFYVVDEVDGTSLLRFVNTS
ncbi:MAG: hypothetical protein HY269_05780, partial [Deltaproteobacteria bacterium]|nr:hypothetical protein [Deltaproteobacteria bacterium]